MGIRLTSLVIDTGDLATLPAWWAAALGWRLSYQAADEVEVAAPDGHPGIDLTFCSVPEAKAAKNRVHVDLATGSAAEQAAIVDRLIAAGATCIDRSSFPWVVLADPEGNEFCVLEPRPSESDTGTIASVVVDVEDPVRQARFWATAAGWPVVSVRPEGARLRSPSGTGPFLDLVPVPEPKRVKNRVHLDVAPLADEDQQVALRQLEDAGARPADVGQGPEVTWVVLADPEGQEFCLLSPR